MNADWIASSARALHLFGLLAALMLTPGMALGHEPFVLDKARPVQSLGRHLEILEDPAGKLTLQQIRSPAVARQFAPSRAEVPNFGFTSSAYWFHLEMRNELKERQKLLLEIAYPLLDEVELYVATAGGRYKKTVAGDTYPYGRKVIRAFNFFFPIIVTPDEGLSIYLRVKTAGALQVPLNLRTQEGFIEYAHNVQLAYGIYLGLLIFVAWYHLFILISIRDRSYLLYILYVLGTLFYQSSFEGVAQEYFWPGWPWWGNRALSFFCFATIIVAMLFTQVFLNLKRNQPRWNAAVNVYVVLGALGVIGSLLLGYHQMVIFLVIIVVTGAVVIISAGIQSWRMGFLPARLYLAAWAAHMLGVVLLALQKAGLVPKVALTEQGHLFGFASNAIILSFALANRITVLRKDQERAQAKELASQREAAEALEAVLSERGRELDRKTEEFSDAHDRLAEQDRLKTDLITNVSHEVHSPLSLVLTPLEVLLENPAGSLPPSARETLRSASQQGQHLQWLAERMVGFARFGSHSGSVLYERCDLRSLVEPLIHSFEPVVHQKAIQLESSIQEGLPAVYTDPGRLDKVLCNLLSNACRFTESEGSVAVELGGDDRSVSITVKDTGPGIGQELLDQMLGAAEEGKGSGPEDEALRQGLRMSRRLVEAIGGTLDGRSEPGQGCAFTVRLPLGTDHITDPALIRAPLTPADSSWAGFEEPTPQPDRQRSPAPDADRDRELLPLVVVIESREEVRHRLTEPCRLDFAVLEATDGEQGIALIRKHRPALVIAAARLPGISGYELIRLIRGDRDTALIPVLLLREPLIATHLFAAKPPANADDYLRESFEPEELRARAINLIRLREQQRELQALNAGLQQEVHENAADLELATLAARSVPPWLVRTVIKDDRHRQQLREERDLTIFLMELRGFDELAEHVESADMVAMLNVYLSEAVEVGFAHGATMDRITRDIIMGFFGAPESLTPVEGALRCVGMAKEMWQRVRDSCSRWGRIYEQVKPPAPTMVLTSGKALVGIMGPSHRRAYTAIGEVADEAMEQLPRAPDGAVVCCDATLELIKGKLEIAEEPIAPKLHRIVLPEQEVQPQDKAPRSSDMVLIDEKASATRWDMDDLAAGLVVNSRYRIIRRIGDRGRGTVYKARDIQMARDVALKVIQLDARADTRLVGKFYRRVKLARLVTHPGIAGIHEIDEYHGYILVAMQYLDGHTLDRSRLWGQDRSLHEGLRLFWQLTGGLAAAHAAGIAHGFLNPANIMLAEDGRPIILNLGVAGWDHQVQMTQGGKASPSFAPPLLYLAPERFLRREPDHGGDIYSLGMLAYKLFTGHLPGEAEGKKDMAGRRLLGAPRDPRVFNPELSAPMSALILRCLARSPQDRFGSISEIVTHLHVHDLVVEREVDR